MGLLTTGKDSVLDFSVLGSAVWDCVTRGLTLSVDVSSESSEDDEGGGELGSCEFQNSRVLLMFSRMS